MTLGKPMGNGYPVAAVVTRRELAERFPYAGRTVLAPSAATRWPPPPRSPCSTRSRTSGSPSARAGVGERLRTAVETLRKPDVVEVRGRGLLAGIQLSSSELATRVTEELREHGILVGRTGKRGDVLKIRPPLVFTDEHAGVLVGALDRILG